MVAVEQFVEMLAKHGVAAGELTLPDGTHVKLAGVTPKMPPATAGIPSAVDFRIRRDVPPPDELLYAASE